MVVYYYNIPIPVFNIIFSNDSCSRCIKRYRIIYSVVYISNKDNQGLLELFIFGDASLKDAKENFSLTLGMRLKCFFKTWLNQHNILL